MYGRVSLRIYESTLHKVRPSVSSSEIWDFFGSLDYQNVEIEGKCEWIGCHVTVFTLKN